MMILAQLQSVEAEFLKNFLLVLVGLASGAGAVVALFRRRRLIEPQPLEIAHAKEFVTVADCRRVHDQVYQRVEEHSEQIKALWQTVREDKDLAEASASRRSAGLYVKIDEVRKEMSSITEQIRKEMTKGFQDVERALGRLEGRITKE